MTVRRVAASVVLVLAAFLVISAAGLGWYLFSGRYSVAATEPHPPAVEDAIARIYHASVRRHAAGISAPPLDRDRAAAGAPLYAAECAMCHAVPGDERDRWAEGLHPLPPHLPEDGSHFEPAEIFWIIRHGIKLTGMPGFRHALSDDEIWSITALVAILHGMAPEEYQDLIALAAAEEDPPAPDEPQDEATAEDGG